MKLLIDENLPKKLKLDFSEHDVYTVADKKWNSKKNGELLELMVAENFDALFTFDRNLQFQQNFNKYHGNCSKCAGQYLFNPAKTCS